MVNLPHRFLLDRVEGLILLSNPMKGIVLYSYKDQAMKMLTRDKGALSPARQSKGTTDFTGLCGSMAWHISPAGV